MSEQERYTKREMLDHFEESLRWLGRVVTIAIGTCLGITLFVVLVMGRIEDKMRDVNFGPFTTTTTTTTPTWSLPHSP